MMIEIRRATYKSSPEVRTRIGTEVLAARADGVAWKLLERRHGYCRQRLAMLAEEARVANVQQDSGIMAAD